MPSNDALKLTGVASCTHHGNGRSARQLNAVFDGRCRNRLSSRRSVRWGTSVK
jgi:hypothetical protein